MFQTRWKQAFLKDLTNKTPKYLCNLMTIVADVVLHIPKVAAPKQGNEPKKLKTLLHFFEPIAPIKENVG